MTFQVDVMLLAIVALSLTNPFKDFLVSFLHGNAPFVHVATTVTKNLAKVLNINGSISCCYLDPPFLGYHTPKLQPCNSIQSCHSKIPRLFTDLALGE